MNRILKILILVLLSFVTIQSVNAWIDLGGIFKWTSPKVNVDCAWWDCSLDKWTVLVKDTLHNVETKKPFSEYIQDIIFYVLSFVSFIAVVYIIYAWFKILLSWGDDEENKKAKWIIKAVIIWILLIWLAYPITAFIIKALTATPA
jgi:hypothetical protein